MRHRKLNASYHKDDMYSLYCFLQCVGDMDYLLNKFPGNITQYKRALYRTTFNNHIYKQ